MSIRFWAGCLAVVGMAVMLGMPNASYAVSVQKQHGATQSVIHLNHGLVTAHIVQQPLRKVLRQLADASGVRFRVGKKVKGKVSITANGVDLPHFLHRMLRRYNVAMAYVDSDAATHNPMLLRQVDVLNAGSHALSDEGFEMIAASRKGGDHTQPQWMHRRGGTASGAQAYSRYGYAAGALSVPSGQEGTQNGAVGNGRPDGVDRFGRARIKLASLHRERAQIQHRMRAEQQAIRSELARVESRMGAAAPAQQLMLAKQAKVLKSQGIRARQRSVARLLQNQRNMKMVAAARPHILTEAELSRQAKARLLRQHAAAVVMRKRQL